MYEHIVTFGFEIQLFWGREVTGAAILFFANRYLALVYYVALAYYRCLSVPDQVSHIIYSGG